MKFKTQWNAKEFPRKREKNDAPSMTKQDDAMSVKEMIDRYVHGLPIQGDKVPMYYGDLDVTDITKMDLVDQQEALENLREQSKRLDEEATVRADLIRRKKLETEKAQRDKLKKELRDEMARESEADSTNNP